MCAPQCLCGGQKPELLEPLLSHRVGPRDRTQIISLGRKQLYPLSCLAGIPKLKRDRICFALLSWDAFNSRVEMEAIWGQSSVEDHQ